jgi:cyclopropane-fatty-acyl-phospholipid synthase
MRLAPLFHELLGHPATIGVEAFDGSTAGPAVPDAVVVIRSPDALRRIAQRPGELGVARAFIAGDVDIDGDVYAVLRLVFDGLTVRPSPALVSAAVRAVGADLLRPLPPPPEEARLGGRLHSKLRDAEAISHHYDVSNDFYRLVLGPAMTYSCAVFRTPHDDLADAQARKHELVSRKLGLEPGMRLLDVGCGWGSMLIHAARHHGIQGVGVTISRAQAELAAKRVAEAGLTELVQIRLQDYRDVDDGPFDAISSIGMFEHVGRAQMPRYDRNLHALLRPGGRLLNHGICRPGYPQPDSARGRAVETFRRVATAIGSDLTSRIDSPLMKRYVFPDGELHEIGTVVSLMSDVGFETRHVENLREHYALTLRRWVANLEAGWDDAVAMAGEGRARVWRIYMAGCALGFELGSTQVHQVLAVRAEGAPSGLPLRPSFEPDG